MIAKRKKKRFEKRKEEKESQRFPRSLSVCYKMSLLTESITTFGVRVEPWDVPPSFQIRTHLWTKKDNFLTYFLTLPAIGAKFLFSDILREKFILKLCNWNPRSWWLALQPYRHPTVMRDASSYVFFHFIFQIHTWFLPLMHTALETIE